MTAMTGMTTLMLFSTHCERVLSAQKPLTDIFYWLSWTSHIRQWNIIYFLLWGRMGGDVCVCMCVCVCVHVCVCVCVWVQPNRPCVCLCVCVCVYVGVPTSVYWSRWCQGDRSSGTQSPAGCCRSSAWFGGVRPPPRQVLRVASWPGHSDLERGQIFTTHVSEVNHYPPLIQIYLIRFNFFFLNRIIGYNSKAIKAHPKKHIDNLFLSNMWSDAE